jgi:hypothetical protein
MSMRGYGRQIWEIWAEKSCNIEGPLEGKEKNTFNV